MKVLFLSTHTPNCEPFWRSLEAIGYEVQTIQYDAYPHDRHGELVREVKATNSDFIVYIGAYAPSHDKPVPTPYTLCAIREIAPFILLCGDAADDPWWPVLEDYHKCGCFSAMVAIDGSFHSPIASFPEGLTLLTPLDPRFYSPLPWEQRSIKLGMIGGQGHRGQMISELQSRGVLDYRAGPVGRSYADFANTLCQTKLTLNLAQTGTGKYLHVKGRVIESGFAGAAVLETQGSLLATWFTPGIDYLEYVSAADVVRQVQDTPDTELQNIAKRFHAKVLERHNPVTFWQKVLEKAKVL